MKKDFVMPVLVLTLICLIMSGVLAAANSITQPVIEKADAERAEQARKEIIPDADKFMPLETENFPHTISEAYGTNNNKGFIFMVTASGYGGEIKLICGIDTDGKIIKSAVLAHAETQGLGTAVFDKADEYEGKDENLDGIDAVAGATITSNAFKNGILDAFEAFRIIKEANS